MKTGGPKAAPWGCPGAGFKPEPSPDKKSPRASVARPRGKDWRAPVTVTAFYDGTTTASEFPRRPVSNRGPPDGRGLWSVLSGPRLFKFDHGPGANEPVLCELQNSYEPFEEFPRVGDAVDQPHAIFGPHFHGAGHELRFRLVQEMPGQAHGREPSVVGPLLRARRLPFVLVVRPRLEFDGRPLLIGHGLGFLLWHFGGSSFHHRSSVPY
jgi:hypothetical protein